MRYLLTLALCLAAGLALAGEFTVTGGFRVSAGDPPKKAAPVEEYDPGIPKGAKKYRSARWSQNSFILNDRDTIRPIRVRDLPDKRWHQPGGMEGVSGWKNETYRTLPEGKTVRTFVGNLLIENSIKTGRLKPDGTPEHHKQWGRTIQRLYPDGTRFDEVLRNAETGRVFEHRVREKKDGKWLSTVYHKDEGARPAGYTGLTVSCTSCHGEAGTGKYDKGLVPGGDTVLGDPLDWGVWPYEKNPEVGASAPVPPPQAVPFAQPLYYVPQGKQNCPT